MSVAVGQHLLLPCETGAVNPPEQSTWMKDGIKVTGNEVSVNANCVQSLYILRVPTLFQGLFRSLNSGKLNFETFIEDLLR